MARVSAENREQYLHERREQVLDAAIEVFGSQGFEGANVDEIAQVAGISKGTIYLYFKSKEEIFRAILAERSLLPRLSKLMAGTGPSVEETLITIGMQYLEYMQEHLPIVRMVLTDAPRFPAYAEQVYTSLIMVGNDALAKFLDREVEAGHLRPSGDTFLTARAIMGMFVVYIFTQEFLEGKRFTPIERETWVRHVVRLFLDGTRA